MFHFLEGIMMKRKLLVLVLLCCIASMSAAALTVDYQGATADTTTDAGPLVYGIDAAGAMTGPAIGNDAQVMTGNAPVTDLANLLTINAWDIGTAYPAVVDDASTTDFLESAVSGTTWDTTALTADGVLIKTGNGAGLVPSTGNNKWNSNEFLIVDFVAPAGDYGTMDIGFTAVTSIKAFLVGDAVAGDGASRDAFSASLNPGDTLSVLLMNVDAINGSSSYSKRLWSITADFVPIPEPATIAIFGLGGLLLRHRRA